MVEIPEGFKPYERQEGDGSSTSTGDVMNVPSAPAHSSLSSAQAQRLITSATSSVVNELWTPASVARQLERINSGDVPASAGEIAAIKNYLMGGFDVDSLAHHVDNVVEHFTEPDGVTRGITGLDILDSIKYGLSEGSPLHRAFRKVAHQVGEVDTPLHKIPLEKISGYEIPQNDPDDLFKDMTEVNTYGKKRNANVASSLWTIAKVIAHAKPNQLLNGARAYMELGQHFHQNAGTYVPDNVSDIITKLTLPQEAVKMNESQKAAAKSRGSSAKVVGHVNEHRKKILDSIQQIIDFHDLISSNGGNLPADLTPDQQRMRNALRGPIPRNDRGEPNLAAWQKAPLALLSPAKVSALRDTILSSRQNLDRFGRSNANDMPVTPDSNNAEDLAKAAEDHKRSTDLAGHYFETAQRVAWALTDHGLPPTIAKPDTVRRLGENQGRSVLKVFTPHEGDIAQSLMTAMGFGSTIGGKTPMFGGPLRNNPSDADVSQVENYGTDVDNPMNYRPSSMSLLTNSLGNVYHFNGQGLVSSAQSGVNAGFAQVVDNYDPGAVVKSTLNRRPPLVIGDRNSPRGLPIRTKANDVIARSPMSVANRTSREGTLLRPAFQDRVSADQRSEFGTNDAASILSAPTNFSLPAMAGRVHVSEFLAPYFDGVTTNENGQDVNMLDSQAFRDHLDSPDSVHHIEFRLKPSTALAHEAEGPRIDTRSSTMVSSTSGRSRVVPDMNTMYPLESNDTDRKDALLMTAIRSYLWKNHGIHPHSPEGRTAQMVALRAMSDSRRGSGIQGLSDIDPANPGQHLLDDHDPIRMKNDEPNSDFGFSPSSLTMTGSEGDTYDLPAPSPAVRGSVTHSHKGAPMGEYTIHLLNKDGQELRHSSPERDESGNITYETLANTILGGRKMDSGSTWGDPGEHIKAALSDGSEWTQRPEPDSSIILRYDGGGNSVPPGGEIGVARRNGPTATTAPKEAPNWIDQSSIWGSASGPLINRRMEVGDDMSVDQYSGLNRYPSNNLNPMQGYRDSEYPGGTYPRGRSAYFGAGVEGGRG